MKYTLDTNIIRALVNSDSDRCNLEYLKNTILNNDCIVSYGTLFEIFNQYSNSSDSLHFLLNILNLAGIEVAVNKEIDCNEFIELFYQKNRLSSAQLKSVFNSLMTQTSYYVSKLLSEALSIFAILYAYMKLNITSDAYEKYLCYTAFESNNFLSFPQKTLPFFKCEFELSYLGQNENKFSHIVTKQFWGVIRTIEVRYNVLANHPQNYLKECDWKTEFDAESQKFDSLYSQENYQGFIKDSYNNLQSGMKKIKDVTELFNCVNYSQLTNIERDFIEYYLKRLLITGGKFKYNDIIDFMNLSIANRHSNALLTLDSKFLKKTVSNFKSIINTEFYNTSVELSRQLRKRK